MRKYILTILLILAILFSVFAIYQYSKDDSIYLYSSNKLKNINNKNTSLNENPATNAETINQENQVTTPDKSEKIKEPSNAKTEENNQTNPANSSDEIIPVQLPSDINTSSCGLYYSQYYVCAGQCPSGTCVSEGRSCYCKNV